MRVGVITHGTRGDTQPFLAIAQQLRVRGHEVAICCPASCSQLVREHGFEAYGMRFDAKKLVQGERMQRAMATGDGNECLVAFFESVSAQKAAGADSEEEASAFVAAYRPDIVLCHISMKTAAIIAELHGLPVLLVMFMPYLPSRVALPAFKTSAQLAAEGLLDDPLEANRQMLAAFHDTDLAEFNALRERWGLCPHASLADLHAAVQAIPVANCWSEAVVPEPADLAVEFPLSRQTGYLFAELPPGYTPPADLLRFLEAPGQERPVYVGFGSLSAGDPRVVTETVLRALVLAGGRRCVMVGGWSGIGPEHLDPELTPDYRELKRFADERVLKVDAVPHGWLLPLCAAAVHHGGAGTTAATVRAGLPTAIAPFAWDQPWWAEQLEALGTGIALPTMITQLSAEALGAAIRRLTEDSEMVASAAALGARVRGERCGAERLVEFAEDTLAAPFAWATSRRPEPTPPPPALWDRPAAALTVSPDAPSGKPLEPVAGAGAAQPWLAGA